jgi:predicted AAA+ superfamily ATPase
MIHRSLEKKIIQSLEHFPVVGILGSRQVGKTTLAKELRKKINRSTIYIDLELPSDLNKLKEPELYLAQFTDFLVIIDEIQRMPDLFPLLRALIDQDRKPGRFLILGSASLDLIKKASDTLAGRIIYHELSPLSTTEVGNDNKTIENLWLKGGYPNSYLSGNLDLSFTWREAFIRTYLERDIPQLGIHIPSTQLRRFWTMIAHCHGQLWNASQISNSLGISSPTVKRYLDILDETFIVRQLQPFYTNIKKRLVKSPKVYIRDSGILHTLLMTQTMDDLQGHPAAGHSWEGFAIEQIISLIPADYQTYFYRTSAGAEIDLLIFASSKEPIAIEIKYSSSPRVERGFWNAFEDLNCKRGYVVYPGSETYPLGKNVFALPLGEIEKLLR